jgi:hypothetical protein
MIVHVNPQISGIFATEHAGHVRKESIEQGKTRLRRNQGESVFDDGNDGRWTLGIDCVRSH